MKFASIGKLSRFVPRKNRKLAVSLYLAGVWVPILSAQQASPSPNRPPPLPPGPWLERAPDFSQWTIVSKTAATQSDAQKNAQATPAATPAPNATGQKPPGTPTDTATTVVKTRDIRFVQIVQAGGSKVQKWCFPDMQLTVRGRSAPLVSLTGGAAHATDYVDFSKSDFGNFEWITAKNYTGVAKVLGQDCLIFKDKAKIDAEGSMVAAVACIAIDSRMPIALYLGEEVRTYQFGPPPSEMLVPPPEISKALEKWRKSLHQAALPPSKP